jgi:mono/diheme cytochrome c family protein
LEDLSSAQLVEKLGSPNGWIQDTAQRLLVERANPNVLPALKAQATHSTNPVTQIHTAWTLDGLGQMDRDTLFSLLADPQPKVRATAIRLSESFLHGPLAEEILHRLTQMAEKDLDPNVQRQLAFTFGQTTRPEAQRGLWLVAIRSAASPGLGDSAARPLLREAIITSLYQRELEFAKQLAQNWQMKASAPLLQGLAECVVNSRDTNRIGQLLELASVRMEWQQSAILDGMNARARAKMKKIYFASEPKGLAQMRHNPKLAGRIEKLEELLTWPAQPGYVPPPYVPPLTAAEQKAYDLGRNLFGNTCAACHQPTGLGAAGVAPPLVDSEWVLGSDERLARIVLQGVQGPIKAAGVNFDSEMPSWASFNDEQLAGILTYIRRDWEQGAPPVKPATVKDIREATARRDGAWTSADLSKIP